MTRVLRILMALDGVDQQAIASEVGMDTGALSRAMNGQRRWQLSEIERLAQVFEVPASKFLEPADRLVLVRGGDDDPGGSSAPRPRRQGGPSTGWYSRVLAVAA